MDVKRRPLVKKRMWHTPYKDRHYVIIHIFCRYFRSTNWLTHFFLRYVAFSSSSHCEACFISIIWKRPILQFAVQSLTRAFCSWPSCRGYLWYEGCYWEGDVISFCSFDVFIQDAYYGDSSFSSEDLVGPLFKIVPHCLSCRTVGWQSLDVSQQLPSPLRYGDRQWFCSCGLIQFVVGYFMWPPDPNNLSQLSSMKTV